MAARLRVAPLDKQLEWDVILLKRQYLQMLDPEKLRIPTFEALRSPVVQAKIYNTVFNDNQLAFAPPVRYKFRVLKRIIDAIEQSIFDPEEDEISDDLTDSLAQILAHPLVPAHTAALQKSYVTYTTPALALDAPEVTLLEARSLLAASGVTGLRTWEAAIFLGTFLCHSENRRLSQNQAIIELGAGTGFLSILCAKHLGAGYVLATDGSSEVIHALDSNVSLNRLDNRNRMETAVLKWGHATLSEVLKKTKKGRPYDLILGADVTYDDKSIPPLVSTLRTLFDQYPGIKALISATIRNANTWSIFTNACTDNDLRLQQLPFDAPDENAQTGFFHPTSTPIRVFMVTKAKGI